MSIHQIVSREKWIEARRAHLAKEKQLTRQRDELARERRKLPWVRVDKDYRFDSPRGEVTLADRSEEHTSELQSRENLVCRLLLEKKNPLTSSPLVRLHPRPPPRPPT